MKRSQRGTSFIELMIVIALIGLLTVQAIPLYTDYGIRVQISEGLNLAGSAKAAVTSYYHERRVFPTDNTQAGLAATDGITGKYVESISVNGRVLTIRYGKDAHILINGQTINLTAVDNAGSLRWTCTNNSFIQLNQLPAVCR